jgi:hypothetical protein
MTDLSAHLANGVPDTVHRPIDVVATVARNLVSSAEPAVVFTSLAQLCVPHFSDACAVDVVEERRTAYRLEYPQELDHARIEQQPHVTTTFCRRADDPGASYRGVIVHAWNAGATPRGVSSAHDLVARLLVDYAVEVVSRERLVDRAHEAEIKAANLEIALRHSREIGYAIGILMATYKISADAAFDAIRTVSQHTHRKLRDVAVDVVRTGGLNHAVSARRPVPVRTDRAVPRSAPDRDAAARPSR